MVADEPPVALEDPPVADEPPVALEEPLVAPAPFEPLAPPLPLVAFVSSSPPPEQPLTMKSAAKSAVTPAAPVRAYLQVPTGGRISFIVFGFLRPRAGRD